MKTSELSKEECLRILQSGETGVLCTSGQSYPYAVPVNYVFCDGKIYIHGKQSGTKVENILRNACVSFCVVGRAEVIAEQWTTLFESVVVFGKARMLDDNAEKLAAMRALMAKYAPKVCPPCMNIDGMAGLGIMEIAAESVTGRTNLQK